MATVVRCPCGTEFGAPDWKLRAGRAKYCSNVCKHRYRPHPTGLTYTIKVENPAWIRPGQHLSPGTEFQVGEVPHNWKGDEAGYCALHDWVTRCSCRAGDHACSECGHDGAEDRLEWANLSHEYRRDLADWIVLCRRCHIAYDRRTGWGDATERFGLVSRRKANA